MEKIEIIDDRDPWLKGRGEVWFVSRVRSRNNGGRQQDVRIPESGVIKISDKPQENVIAVEREIFRGWVEDDLAIQLSGTEEDTFDPDDPLGKYSRIFCGNVRDWYGSYGPSDEPVDPEDVGAWRIFYRIEPI